jgi:uncharacterized protein
MTEILTPEQFGTIRAFLSQQSTLALATVDDTGRPQIAPVFYVHDDALNLYWLSSPTSRHSINLAAWDVAAATIYPVIWEWEAIRGLQIDGSAQVVEAVERRKTILEAYRRKFTLPTAFEAQIAASTLYCLEPMWLRWLDNGVRFGYKAEATLNEKGV